MILEIRLSNMFSIKDEVTLDLTSGGSVSHNAKLLSGNCFKCLDVEMLKTTAIYGANASGKSNIIKAIRLCRDIVLNSHNYNEGTAFAYEPFKFDGYDSRPSNFAIRFISSGVEYEYSFSFTRDGIETEQLFHTPKGRRAEVFSRDESKGPGKKDIYTFRPAVKRPFDVAVNTSRKTLFISRASQMDREVAKEVYNFFLSSIVFNNGLTAEDISSLFPVNRRVILSAMKIADSDIVDIRMKNESGTPVFTTYHIANPDIPFDMDTEESGGTRKLFYSMLRMLEAIRNGATLFWDEIETSLHCRLVEYIFSLFNSSDNAQLVCTTHNTNLLNLHKIRKDQVYFVNKRIDGSSELYSLFDFKDFRDTMDPEKAYLQGRFDAVPYVDDSASRLKAMIADA